jgi:predicted transcriptional regulator
MGVFGTRFRRRTCKARSGGCFCADSLSQRSRRIARVSCIRRLIGIQSLTIANAVVSLKSKHPTPHFPCSVKGDAINVVWGRLEGYVMANGIDNIDQLIAALEKQGIELRNDPATDAVAAIKRVWAVAYLKGLRHGVVHGLGGIAEAQKIAMGHFDHIKADQGSPAVSVTSTPSLKIDMKTRTQRRKNDGIILDIVHENAEDGITYHYICKAAQGINVILSDSSVRKAMPRLEEQGMVIQREGKWFPGPKAALNSQRQSVVKSDGGEEKEYADDDDTTSS